MRIRTLQARGFRSLRHLDLRLEGGVHVLVGANGSGKSTLFDAIAFLFDTIHSDVVTAAGMRTRNFQDLAWGRPRSGPGFELAMEVELSESSAFRYEIAVQEGEEGVALVRERGYLGNLSDAELATMAGKETVFATNVDLQPVFTRRAGGRKDQGADGHVIASTWLYSGEGRPFGFRHEALTPSIRLVSLLERMQSRRARDDEGKVQPHVAHSADVVRQLIRATARQLQLDGRQLNLASPPNGDVTLRVSSDGGNLPWVVDSLREEHAGTFQAWLEHVRTAIPSIVDVRAALRDDDRHAYLMVRYEDGVEIPSWGVSDGTLRFLVLTILAYLPDDQGSLYLLEEPENGIHPMALDAVYQSLSSAYDTHVMVASHSPSFLRCVEPEQVLCVARGSDGATRITHGTDDARFAHWQESVDNDLLFAPDILG